MATITAVCDECGCGAVYRPSGVSVQLLTHGVILMEFFCVKCRSENRKVIDIDLAEHLESVGVVTTVVHTPGELLEHPPAGTPAIDDKEVGRIEGMTLDVFNRLMQMGWVGDV